ncbi:MAG: hypothetical protein KJ709_07290 [Nanoarchaeota archaeon]|nr:hypothetical protein [Nanoarchaeota archaeon]
MVEPQILPEAIESGETDDPRPAYRFDFLEAYKKVHERVVNLNSSILGLIGIVAIHKANSPGAEGINADIGNALGIALISLIPIYRSDASLERDSHYFFGMVQELYASNPGEMTIRHA